MRPAKIMFLKKQYNILGIADIVSIIKKKGYGKLLMKSMHKYLKDKKKIGIGFCNKKNSLFYKKSGLKLSKGLVKKFIYINPEGKIIKNEWDSDVFYPEGNEKFIKKISQSPKEKVILKCPFW